MKDSPPPAGDETTADVNRLRKVEGEPVTQEGDLPVVARMVIEIRSDGTRTVARGALEDSLSGERVSIEALGGSPAALAASLASSLSNTFLRVPTLATYGVKALVRQALRGGRK